MPAGKPPTDEQRLLALALELSGLHDRDCVLERVLALGCSLTGAHYAALATYHADGQLRRFRYAGVDTADVVPDEPPRGVGLLGELLTATGPVRIDDISADPRYTGVPDRHPRIRSFLGIPLIGADRRHGNLYVADPTPAVFTATHEQTLETLAGFASAALDGIELVAAERRRACSDAEAREARTRADLRAEMLSRVIDAQETERARVSRDLHDDIGQALTSVLLGLRLADTAVQAEPPDPARARAAVEDVRLVVADALHRVRRMAFDLRPTVLDDLGLEAALHRLAAEATHRLGVSVTVAIRGLAPGWRLPPLVETTIYRVVQEATTNASRHAGTDRVDVTVSADTRHVFAEIRDRGDGFDTEQVEAGTLGIRGMQERAAIAAGTLRVDSAPGAGTVVRLEVPLG